MRYIAKYTAIFLLVILPVWLITACQSVTEAVNFSVGPTAAPTPASVFVPTQDIVSVGVGQPLTLTSYHLSPAGFGALKILVNNQPVKTEAAGQQGAIFTDASGRVKLMVDAPTGEASMVKAVYPNSDWTVLLTWLTDAPGVYELELKATDTAGLPGDPIVQWIEVKTP